MAGFAGNVDEGFFMRALLPLRGSVEGARVFVMEMIRRCDSYTDTRRCRESEMTRESNQGYGRSGRKKGRAGGTFEIGVW